MAIDPRFVGHQPMEARHRDELEWETIRWPGETGKMLFHPRPQRPTEPNAGILRLDPGAHHPLHYHDFAQVWYILDGTFRIGGHEYRPGTMIFHPDPHCEDEFHTETGGEILIVQYPGPSTEGATDLRGSLQSGRATTSVIRACRPLERQVPTPNNAFHRTARQRAAGEGER